MSSQISSLNDQKGVVKSLLEASCFLYALSKETVVFSFPVQEKLEYFKQKIIFEIDLESGLASEVRQKTCKKPTEFLYVLHNRGDMSRWRLDIVIKSYDKKL